MRHAKKVALALAALAAASVLAACGGGGDGSTSDGGRGDGETVSGKFAPVAGAPATYSDVSGEATLKRAAGTTTVTLSLSGLEPKTAYIAHLHTGGCDQADPGGPHFEFEPGRSEEPPNEIHLGLTSDAAGDGQAKTVVNREVPAGEAGSIVVHTAGGVHVMAAFVHEGEHHEDAAPDDGAEGMPGHSDKIACAQLEGGSTAVSGEGGETAGNGAVPTIVVRDGEPVGGVRELEYGAGEEIRFRVESDVADEVHVHGYDIAKEVPAAGSVEFDFPADIEGIFEVELEDRAAQIAELRVNP